MKMHPTVQVLILSYLFDRSIEMLSWDDYKCNIKGLRFSHVYGEHEEHKGDATSRNELLNKQRNRYSPI